MQTMMTQMCQLASSEDHNGQTHGRKKISTQTCHSKFLSKYCWTHGLCSHGGNYCRWKAEGHQGDATLDNNMGGGTKIISE